MAAQEGPAGFRLKVIEFAGKRVPILLQNDNGPCPLLAIANILLLRGKIQIHTDYSEVSYDNVAALITEYLIAHNPPLKDHELNASLQYNLQDAINTMPSLMQGLDVNVGFTNITEFEYNKGMIIFDLLNINLYHGWIVDPEDVAHPIIHKEKPTYNHVVEKVIEMKTLAPTPGPNTSVPDPPLNEKQQKVMEEGLLLEMFLDTTSSQLTMQGLIMLHRDIEDGTLGVFFRNNHFATLLKHRSKLYLLMTDLGYAKEEHLVWEVLDMVNNDTMFVDGQFRRFVKSEQDKAIKERAEKQAAGHGGIASGGPGFEMSERELEEQRAAYEAMSKKGKSGSSSRSTSPKHRKHQQQQDSQHNPTTAMTAILGNDDVDRELAMQLQAQEDHARSVQARDQQTRQHRETVRRSSKQSCRVM